MTKPITIAVDAMGGDDSPNKVIKGISIHHKTSNETNYKIFGSRQEYKTIYFKCEIVSNNKFLLNEGQKYKFHSFDQVKKLNIVH